MKIGIEEVFMYKVVDNDNKSIFASGKFCKTYTNGSVVEKEPNSIGLFVFKELERALSYLRTIEGMEKCDEAKIKLVKIIGSFKEAPSLVVCLNRSSNQEIYINDYNENGCNYSGKHYFLSDPSYKSIVCDKLIVIMEVISCLRI